jgi:hypothetical protein
MRLRILSLLLSVPAALALAQNPNPGGQIPGRLPVFPQLTRYLELKPDQIVSLAKINLQWQQYLDTKNRRVAEVEAELRHATLADPVDPYALGVRYAELEAICREARDTDHKLQGDARKLLTPAQLAKIATLEQAYALLPVIGEAGSALLMNAPLPGLQMAAIASAAASRHYPGCRFNQPAAILIPAQ